MIRSSLLGNSAAAAPITNLPSSSSPPFNYYMSDPKVRIFSVLFILDHELLNSVTKLSESFKQDVQCVRMHELQTRSSSISVIHVNNNNNNNNTTSPRRYLWCCHHGVYRHCESSPGSYDECRLTARCRPLTLRPPQRCTYTLLCKIVNKVRHSDK